MQPCLSCVADYVETRTSSNNQKQLIKEEMDRTREIQKSTDQSEQVIHGDSYVIERIWKNAFQKAKLGKNLKVIPTVHATKEPDKPQRNTLRVIDQASNRDLYIIERIWKNALQKAQLGANFKVVHATKLPKATDQYNIDQALNGDLYILKRLWKSLQKVLSGHFRVISEVHTVKQLEEPQKNKPRAIDQVLHGDLYIIERIWKGALEKAQLSKNLKVLPEVYAIKQPQELHSNTPKANQDNIDLYIIGRIWIHALQKALLGANFNVIPVVHAAKQPETPQKPPKMKYTDLPIYQSPHYEYKEYIEDKDKCPERNTKLLQKFLLPYTKKYRKIAQENLCQAKCIVNKYCVNTCACVKKAKNDFKATMRDPDNLTVRQAVVGVGTLTGYLLGGGGGLPRRFFFTSIGFLTTGALCFPKETDEVFRSFTYMVAKAVLSMYNMACSKNADLRERLACREDLPPPPPQRKPLQCPPKK
ncbi:uncharacterized protein LOC123878988 [Maniola jurtina]|uniref:uncharacterized protein LOC123878988 n=1 Tax=Maniola jurtina TaxID=191418 RepID=UPI001E686C5F|nr:uncharacterized protein LOC123878988 [Maniola jurtina]